jgi:hypothetical protein
MRKPRSSNDSRRLHLESLEERRLLAADLHNAAEPSASATCWCWWIKWNRLDAALPGKRAFLPM